MKVYKLTRDLILLDSKYKVILYKGDAITEDNYAMLCEVCTLIEMDIDQLVSEHEVDIESQISDIADHFYTIYVNKSTVNGFKKHFNYTSASLEAERLSLQSYNRGKLVTVMKTVRVLRSVLESTSVDPVIEYVPDENGPYARTTKDDLLWRVIGKSTVNKGHYILESGDYLGMARESDITFLRKVTRYATDKYVVEDLKGGHESL